jgi:hypothetical protein
MRSNIQYDWTRLLLNPDAPDAEDWTISKVGWPAESGVRFRTGGVNGRDAKMTAVGNLADISEWGVDVALYNDKGELIATARYGLVRLESDNDAFEHAG